jgi:hypothetical protein
MKPRLQTLILVALASGMLASAYMIAPAPGATASGAPQLLVARAVAPPPPPPSTIKTFRAPVPLLIGAHSEFFTASPTDATPVPAPSTDIATIAPARIDDAAARVAIEQDGYRNVKELVKGPDGSWHGRALRGSTEVAVRVDASGSVATD